MGSDEDILINKLKKLQDAVAKDDIKKTKEIIDWFQQNLERNKQILSKLYTSNVEYITRTDIILAACQSRNVEMLDFILFQTDILVHFTGDSLYDTEANKQITEAFRHALRLEQFVMVRILYNYWCGNWQWKQQDMKNVEIIGNVLIDALNVLGPDTNLRLQVDFQSLITLNAFQREACTELVKLKPSNITPKETAAMILKVLRIYHRYSHFEWHPDIVKPIPKHQQKIKADVEDMSRYEHISLIMIYENYFRSMDFYISSIILMNLNILKKHLKNRFNKTETYFKDNPNLEKFYKRGAESYKEFESETYQFIYCTSHDWRLPSLGKKIAYMQKDKITLAQNEGKSALIKYLERKNFRRNLKKFAKILRIHVISRDPAENGIGTQIQSKNTDKTKVVPLIDENYLQMVRYMCNHYSLQKIVNYIEVIENTNEVNVLMIERVLHVIGEMLKSTDDSNHLTRPSLALLQIAISVETVRHLNNLRDFLSKANKGQLSTRIDVANTQAQTLFVKIKEELIIMKHSINSVHVINWRVLEKSIFEKSYDMINREIKRLPEEAQAHIKELCRLKVHIDWLGFEEFHQFYQEVWKPTGLSVQLLKIISYLEHNKHKIFHLYLDIIKVSLNNDVALILPSFIQNVRRMLKLIIENNNKVNTINQQLSNYDKSAKMCDCPDGDEINRTQNKVARLIKRNKKVQIDLDLLSEIKNYIHHWNSIKDMIRFCLTECDLFASISHLNLNEGSLPDTLTVAKVNNILRDMEAICLMHRSTSLVTLKWWQRIYRLFSKWLNWKLLRSTHFDGIEKLIGDFTAAKDLKQNDPRIERDKLISCLIKRLDQLKQTLLYPQRISLHQNVRRFKHDVKFSLILEMIMADITNILVVCNIRLMKKSSMFLRKVDLGNVLDHGNPFIDVINNCHWDFATELLEKAMMYAEDGEAIEALYELFKGNVGYDTIKAGDQLKMDARQQQLYDKFKKSPNWESYAKLIRLPIFKP